MHACIAITIHSGPPWLLCKHGDDMATSHAIHKDIFVESCLVCKIVIGDEIRAEHGQLIL